MDKSRTNSAGMQRVIKRGIVTATALAAVTGVAAPVSFAAPTGSVARAAGIGTSDEQRVDAAAVVHLDPSPDVLLLSDGDFIHALWQKARDAGDSLQAVRMAAEEVMMVGTSAEDQARFITTGIHNAYEVDKQREKDRADADRAARAAKQRALITVGMPVSSELLGLSDDNFVRAIMNHPVIGKEVKDAAARALAGNAAAWQEFITTGAREAHQRDVTQELKEKAEKEAEELRRKEELKYRKATLALFETRFKVTFSDAALDLSDDDLIRELLRLTPADEQRSELYAAAQRAILSPDPAAWKEFLHTGAPQANKRDYDNILKKQAEANRKQALQIQARAEKTGVHPGLVAAAKKALAGSDVDVTEFLMKGQHRATRQSFQAISANLSGWYIRQSDADKGEAFLAPVSGKGKQADREDATWDIKPALTGQPGCYSFESVRKPGYYLMQKSFRVRMAADDTSSAFRKDATWCARKGLTNSGTSFESASQPGRWLRQFQGDLYAADKSGKNRYEAEKDFAQDATWKISAPLAR
ncbi:AbfB domain-containing protein [Streptomyces sp. WZ-12]|uniref:AbfB domain-containing protein n=1 Tax=Streptomyces sp. WZ-12 TaxID=3030210 RepID=UPI0023813CA0|nr:AbfB domain-containing protein [Streptomyces sp. WZ-12]